jgi:hypothetical protein
MWRNGDMETWTWIHGHGHGTWRHGHGYMDVDKVHEDMDRETWTWRHGRSQAIFLNVTIRSSEVFVCPFVDKETNGSYPFENGLNGLNRKNELVQLCNNTVFSNNK